MFSTQRLHLTIVFVLPHSTSVTEAVKITNIHIINILQIIKIQLAKEKIRHRIACSLLLCDRLSLLTDRDQVTKKLYLFVQFNGHLNVRPLSDMMHDTYPSPPVT